VRATRHLCKGTALAGLSLLAACAVVPPAAPPPSTPPLPAPATPPLPQLAPPAPERLWDVADLTPGQWSYEVGKDGRIARYGEDGRDSVLALRCDFATRRLILMLPGAETPTGAVTIRTSNGDLVWPYARGADGAAMAMVSRSASDPGFDAMAFSRGRISIERPGAARAIVPVWAELARVVEDCRN
jgi:hypothetical protein